MHENSIHTIFGLSPLWLATSILILTYAVIISERFNRAIVAPLGAAVVIGTGVLTQEQAVHGIDFNTIGLLTGMMILVGDTFHNFVDGILIAAAFMTDIQLGIVTTIAIIAHEIPQEVGDFVILLHSGFSRARALAFNLLSSVATLVGGLLAYFALQSLQDLVPPLLGLAAASMIYIAVADLIPGLHKRPEIGATAEQVALIALGVGTIVLAGFVVSGFFEH